MRATLSITAARGDVLAACQFEADLRWVNLDMGDADKMSAFVPDRVLRMIIQEADRTTLLWEAPIVAIGEGGPPPPPYPPQPETPMRIGSGLPLGFVITIGLFGILAILATIVWGLAR